MNPNHQISAPEPRSLPIFSPILYIFDRSGRPENLGASLRIFPYLAHFGPFWALREWPFLVKNDQSGDPKPRKFPLQGLRASLEISPILSFWARGNGPRMTVLCQKWPFWEPKPRQSLRASLWSILGHFGRPSMRVFGPKLRGTQNGYFYKIQK